MRKRIRAGGRFRRGDLLLPLRNMDGVYIRNISHREATKLVAGEQARWIFAEPGKISGLRLKVRLRAMDSSPCCITEGDMLSLAHDKSRTANLTEFKKRARMANNRDPEDSAELSMVKITLWPIIGSSKAIRTGTNDAAVAAAKKLEAEMFYEGARIAVEA